MICYTRGANLAESRAAALQDLFAKVSGTEQSLHATLNVYMKQQRIYIKLEKELQDFRWLLGYIGNLETGSLAHVRTEFLAVALNMVQKSSAT